MNRSLTIERRRHTLPNPSTSKMRLLRLFVALSALLWTSTATSDNLTDLVTWDPYSLTVNGSRVFVLYVFRLIGLITLTSVQCWRVPLSANASTGDVASQSFVLIGQQGH
jgi:hypothetical protein